MQPAPAPQPVPTPAAPPSPVPVREETPPQPSFVPPDVPAFEPPAPVPVPDAPPAVPAAKPRTSASQEIAQASAQARPIPDEEWNGIVAAVGQINQPLCGALNGSRGYVSGQRVLISGSDFFLRMIREDAGAKKSLKTVLAEHYGQPFGIGPYTAAPKETPMDRFDRLASTAASMGIALEGGDAQESLL